MRSRQRPVRLGRCRFRTAARWLETCATRLRRRMEFLRCSRWMRKWNWPPRPAGAVMPLGQFIAGNRKTLRRPDEILAAVFVPRRMENAASAFLKLGARRYLVISISMVAAVVQARRRVASLEAHVAVGSCSATAQRLTELEQDLVGVPAASRNWMQSSGPNIFRHFLRSTMCAPRPSIAAMPR